MNSLVKQQATTTTTHGGMYTPGLEDLIVGETALCQIDEGDSGLRYRGYAIGDLAEYASYEEVAFLLLYGKLPTHKELKDFFSTLRLYRILPDPVEALLRTVPPNAHPQDILRTAVSFLGTMDPDDGDRSHEVSTRKAIRLLAQIPLIVAAAHRLTHSKPVARPRDDLDVAGNLLYMLTDSDSGAVARVMARILDVSLILYAEHEFNASTFAARVAASTLTDLHSAITAAIGTLKGPLHGGANEAVATMLLAIGDPGRAETWVRDALHHKQRIMGFGHRVLKRGDARSDIMQGHAEELSRACKNMRWYDIATILHRTMLRETGLSPNLDFYTAVAYLLMGIPRNLYTSVFVCSRIAGWCAHVMEQQGQNRLIRPRAKYTGLPPQTYVTIGART